MLPESTKQLALAQTPEEFHHAWRGTLAAYDALNEQTIAQTGARLACRAGCSLCCSLRVEVYAHEVFLIADFVLAHFSPEELASLKDRLTAHADKILLLTPFEHATSNNPCPLLRPDGCCSVYAVRPQNCRRHHSLDFAACQFTYDHPDDLEHPAAHERALYRTLTEAMRQNTEVYRQLGYDVTIYELGTALEETLSEPESWAAWRDRMEAFVKASITPAE